MSTDGIFLEARLLAILLAHPSLLEHPDVEINPDWFLCRDHARIFAELKKHGSNDMNLLDLTKDQVKHALNLLLYESFTPENMHAYIRELKKREERVKFGERASRLVEHDVRRNQKLFKDIP